MRVLCIGNRYPPWSIGGYEVIFAHAVAALRASGHVARVLTTLPDPTDLPGEGPVEEEVHRDLRWYWRAHEFPPIGLRATARLERQNAATLRRHLHDHKPDVLVWWAMGGMSLSLLEQARRAGVPAVGVVCDDWILYGPRVDAWTKRWHGMRRLGALGALGAGTLERRWGVPAFLDLDHAARWLFISSYARSTARQSGWALPGASVAHAGVDRDRFTSQAPAPWGWRLLYCGRIDPRKGIATAIEALPHLPSRAILTIHGQGDRAHAAELASIAAGAGVADRVRFEHSTHQAVAGAYAAADALVFPVTWREPWGLVPLEAMSVGRPVLASRAGGGAAEYLEDGRNCLQFDPRDARGLAAGLLRIAGDEKLRSALRTAGAETAERFSENRFHLQLERVLHETTASAR